MFLSNTVVNSFSEQVVLTPDWLALKFKNVELSYRQLDEISNQLAHFLIKKGVTSNTLVPICLKSPLNMVIGIWGILKAGGAFVPVDPEFPQERMKYIIDDTGAEIVITDSASRHFIESSDHKTIVFADDNWQEVKQESKKAVNVNVQGEDIVYVIYTSGSTGLPKGVLIKHESLTNYLDGLFKRIPYKDCKSYALGTTFAADFVITYLFGSLTHGSTLHVFTKDDYNDVPFIHSYFKEQEIDCINIVPSHWKSLSLNGIDLLPRKILAFAGEALYTEVIRHIIPSSARTCSLLNVYGPTETTVGQLLYEIDENITYGTAVPIGKTFTDARVYILDEKGNLITGEGEGELYISGTCVAAGYLNRPELTEERFLKDPFSKNESAVMYRTGDLVRRLQDDNIEFVGRVDDQVKIRGYRIELGEIENVLQNAPGVKQGVVLTKEGGNGDKRLVAYIVSDQYNKEKIISFLERKLPDYMVPRLLVHLDELPFLLNGKVDKKALPNPVASALLTNTYVTPTGKTEILLSDIWKDILSVDRAGAEDNFFELGGTSLLSLKLVEILRSQHKIQLPVVKLYQFPKLKDLASFIDGKPQHREIIAPRKQSECDVAVIGMSGRFPGADSVEEFWKLLKNGKEAITFFSDNDIHESIPDSIKNHPDYVKARGILRDVKGFDPSFFGINPKLAVVMDPQQRVFLEIAWEALEHSGYASEKHKGQIGVFAGVHFNTYYTNNVLSHPDLIENVGNLQVVTLNDKDYVTTRTAYTFNLKGPAVNVQSACSTSLVAIAQAVQSIRDGQCDMALAGGVAISNPINAGHIYEEGAMLSNDGHCRPFDANAKGTLFSDGAGVVLLKRLDEAEKDGDVIYAVVKGVGLSNDGGSKSSFTAPSSEGQAAAISMAIQDAGIAPEDISYIETHGTATPLGDPIEIEGLNMAFGEQAQKQYCAIGSVKSNIGHLTIAAGVTGFIKTCLSLYHKQLPPSINFNQPNPHIDFENSPFYVNNQFKNWDTDKKRTAGVSSFGVGGTNAHIILTEKEEMPFVTTPSRPAKLICWSAKSENSLDGYGDKLIGYFNKNNKADLADVAYTLHTTRDDFNQRRFVVATDVDDFIEQSSNKALFNSNSKNIGKKQQEIVFMFPGQGDQYVNMCKALYESESVFKAAMDECALILAEEMKEDILEVIYPKDINEASTEKIKYTRYSQPALFSIGYALGKLWASWGIAPSVFVGHSIGEFVAAYFAGVFSLKDALKLIATRGKMMNDLPGGNMLSVRLSHEDIQPYLSSTVELAAANGPELSVVAGTVEAIAELSKVLDAKDIPNKILATSHAFHSYMMDDVVKPFEEVVKAVQLNAPLIPIMSSVTGEWMKAEDATNPNYWAKHLRQPVLFSKAIQHLIDESYNLFLELGPGKSVSTLTRQHGAGKPIVAVSSIEKEETQLSSDKAILKALGNLWLNGVEIDWAGFYQNETRQRRVDLPTYAFDKKDYWIDVVLNKAVAPKQSVSAAIVEDQPAQKNELSRKEQLIEKITDIFKNVLGVEMNTANPQMSFIEMGLDSLLLTQVAMLLKKQFAVSISFRQLNEELGNLDLLATYLEAYLPDDSVLSKIAKNKSAEKVSELTVEEQVEIKKPFGAIARIEKQSAQLDAIKQEYLTSFIERYNQKTKASKSYTQEHRAYMADPRVVSGFRPAIKDLVYSIVVNKSKGSRLWDIDGNEYIDTLNGFGSNLLGYQPDNLKQALIEQVEKGYEIGPQHELAGEVCKLISEFTNFDRVGLCNTGSEAVLGAMRIARTVTGRSLIVAFAGSYHGINDEVIARGSKNLKTYPAAPGIMPEAVQNMLILDYGTEESLRIIEERADEIAAVLVEPVQSRRCDFHPIAFLKKLRAITKTSNTVLVFDEVITGFRFHPGGVQAMFGIKADVATYGKVIGGGLSIGAIAGEKKFMDALDGGWWQYGDDSMPGAGVTYFAGTFVRHPLVLATSKASLEYFKAEGPKLQERLNARGAFIAASLNGICREQNVPISVVQFGSLWRIMFKEEYPYAELLFALMRYKGIHIVEGFPCFLTTAHTDEDLQTIIKCFEESVIELKKVNLIPYYQHPVLDKWKTLNTPPVPHAKLGKDKEGNPAWFVKDENQQGKYMQVIN